MLDGVSKFVAEIAAKNGGHYIDAVLEYQTVNQIPDVEDITEALHPIIVEKLKQEYVQKNYFPGRKRENAIPSGFFE